MIYEMGRSIKMGYKAIMIQTYYFTLITWGVIAILMLLFYIFKFSYSWDSFLRLIIWTFWGIFGVGTLMGFVNYFGYKKSYENFGTLSEQIFKKLGFECPEEQDFYNDFLTDDGVQISVMKYRNKLKGQDPYPEDYFDKKRTVETLN